MAVRRVVADWINVGHLLHPERRAAGNGLAGQGRVVE